MSQINSIKLQASCILNVPFRIYEKDFSFIVNGKEFKTNKIVSDLLSPYISKIHLSDPTFDSFIIDTKQRGDFSNILKLINFEPNKYPESELPFLLEVIEILDNDCIETNEIKQKQEITIDNVFNNFQQHEKYSKFYRRLFLQEIEFISSHFSEIYESKEEELTKVTIDTLYSILTNDELQLTNEDQLLKFINKLYTTDKRYSILYETVLFENVSTETVCEFIGIYDSELMTHITWQRISKRLSKEIKNEEENDNDKKRYKEKKTSKIDDNKEKNKILKGISFSKDNEYDGIINYLRKKSNGQIENEINITASTIGRSDENHQPRVVTQFDNNKHFHTNDESNSWLCFDFKEHRIIPTDYSIKSIPYDANDRHPKSWVVECSNDKNSWETVDEEKGCSYLNGNKYSHTFTMNHQKSTEFRYIRIRLTGTNWRNDNYLMLGSFEIYGQYI